MSRPLADLRADSAVTILAADLEDGRPWPPGDRRFAGVIVTNYLHRPLLPAIVAAVAPGGCLIYETFAVGNERLGKPEQPGFPVAAGRIARSRARATDRTSPMRTWR